MIIGGETVYNTFALPRALDGQSGVPPLDRSASAWGVCARSAHDSELVAPVTVDSRGRYQEGLTVMSPDHPIRRPCRCGGTNPSCPQCGGTGVITASAFRGIMSGPAGIRRRPFVPRDTGGTIAGPPVPVRCPHCNFEVLNLAVHLAEDHPDQPQVETDAEREAREQEEARQAAIAAEIARREAEAAQRKAEARARRQAIEGLPSVGPRPEPPHVAPLAPPRHPQHTPERPRDAEERAEPRGLQTSPPQPPAETRAAKPTPRPAEGPMALAFRLAREKKQRDE